jgi:phage terminase large subunit-like protein
MPDDIDSLYEFVLAQTEREKYNHWLTYTPYPKQREFMDLGARYMERLLIAGNQTGKSDAGAYETARHMTGVYPDWWKGRRYDQNTGPCDCWVGGTSGDAVRDGPQGKLFGMPGVSDLFGTGFIPKDCIVGEPTHSRSATNLIDTAFIRHVSGAIRPISFKTYKQSREDWQGPTKNFMWFDEEPPLEIYTEGLARMAATGGSHILTFTPLYGFSDVVKRFLECPAEFAYRRIWVQMALTDAAHMTPEKIAITLSIYPEHEWPARRDGDPHLAGGLVFSAPPKGLEEEPYSLVARQPGFPVPAHWRLLWGIDFGANHPFAAVLLGHDLTGPKEVGHVLHAFRSVPGDALQSHPMFHANHMRSIAANVPVAWPHDGHVHDKGGDQMKIKDIYKSYKLNMLAEHATHPEGGYATEPGIFDLDVAMREGRFKVNRLLSEWFQEYRMYHRDEDTLQIVKKGDDLMSATRIAWMARRHARAVPLGSTIIRPRRNLDGRGDEFNPITGRRDPL